MGVAFTGYAFNGNFEDGGEGVKLGFFRSEGVRIAQKSQRKGRRLENGMMRFDGELLREKGDCYFVDTTVSGSNEGTSSAPKFSLKRLFETTVFPRIEELVGPGGAYEGYLPIIQGDNAGCHQCAEYLSYCEQYCLQRGWRWEPQAPQMPHANNLDLCVFPMMSKRHSDLLREHSNSVPTQDQIWAAACEVWNTMPSSKIARGYVLAYRLMDKVIKSKGRNEWLRDGGLHQHTRKDFVNTDKGIRPRGEEDE